MGFIFWIRSGALAVAILAFAIAAAPLRAEITPATRASLDEDILVFSRLGIARDDSAPVTEVAPDFLFLLDTLQSIVDGPTRLAAEIEPCPADLDHNPDLTALTDADCLSALLRAERTRWRIAAEIAAQVFLIAQESLAADLPLAAPDSLYEDAAARAKAEAWWAENAPRALAAYGRIGREWITLVGANDPAARQAGQAKVLGALARVAREPAAIQLSQALAALPSDAPLARQAANILIALSDSEAPDERLQAVARFAGALDAAYSDAVRAVLLADDGNALCAQLIENGVEWQGLDFGAACPTALETLRATTTVVLKDFATDLETGTTANPEEIETAFQQALLLAFEERITTFRHAIAMLAAGANADSCTAIVDRFASVARDGGRVSNGNLLDPEGVAEAAEGFAALAEHCLSTAPVDWLVELCTMATSGEDAPKSILPASVAAHLLGPWRDVVAAAGDPIELARLCEQPSTAAQGLVKDALARLASAAREAMYASTLAELRPYLDRMRLPANEWKGLAEQGRALCGLADQIAAPGTDAPSDLSSQVRRATLIEIGLLAPDRSRSAELDMLCQAFEGNLPVDTETALRGILENGIAADDKSLPDAAAVFDWTQGVMGRLSEDGNKIATRLAAARAVAEAAAVLDRVQPLNDRADACHGTEAIGLWPGFNVTDLLTDLAAGAAEPWTITVQGTVVLSLCGPLGEIAEPGSGEVSDSLERSTDLIEISAPLKMPPVALDAVPDVESLKRALLTTAREQIRNARIDATNLTVLADAKIRRLAETAGLPIPAIEILGASPLVPEFVAGSGLILRVEFGSREVMVSGEAVRLRDVTLCLAVPLVPDFGGFPAECVTADHFFEAVADALARSVALPILTQLMTKSGLTAPEATTLNDQIVSMVYERGKWVLQITVPEAALKTHVGEDGPLISGDLILRVALPSGTDASSAKVNIVEFPALDATRLLARLAELTSNDFFALRELAQLPQGLGTTDPICTSDSESRQPRSFFQVDLLAAAPVSGRLAYVCMDTVKAEFSIVLAEDTELISSDGQWRFRIERRRLEENYDRGGKLTLAVTVTTSAQGFEKIGEDGADAVVELDLNQGTWRLPADAEKNREIYGAIETSMNRILPEGVRAYGVEFSSDGIQVNLDPEGAASTLIGKAGLDADVDLEAIAAGSCKLLKLVDLARMIASGTSVDDPAGAVVCADSYDPLSTEAEFAAGSIDWECDLAQAKGSRLSECEIGFARDVTFCDVSSLDIAVIWDGQNRNVQSRDLEDCVERSIEALLPDVDGIEVHLDQIAITGRCADDPQSCGFAVTAGLDLAALLGNDLMPQMVRETFGEDCTVNDAARIAVTGRLYLSGAGGVDMVAADPDALPDLLARCVAAVTDWAAAKAIEAAGGNVSAEDALRPLAEAGGAALGALRSTIESTTGLETMCTLTLETAERPACSTLSTEHVLGDGLRGVVFRTRVDLWGSRLDIVARYKIDLSRLTPTQLVAEDFDAEAYWRAVTATADAVFEIACAGGDGAAGATCLDSAAQTLVESVNGEFLAYPGGARIERGATEIRVMLPLEFSNELLPTDLRIEAECRLTLPRRNDGLDGLDFACSADAAEMALTALVESLVAALNEDDEFGLDLGLVAVSLSDPRYVNGEIIIDAKAELAGLEDVLPEGLEEASGTIRIDRSFDIDVQIDWRTFVSALTDHLTDAVNELAGKVLPVRITSITADFADDGAPKALLIESEADIGGLFAISAPALRLSAAGLGLDGPNRFSIKFEEGLQIPVPPVAICPNGGAIEDTKLTIRANVTIAECTASHVLRFTGLVTMDLANPLQLESEGDLVLFSVLPLGHTEGEIDLGVPLLRHSGELGGVAADIISMAAEFEANLHVDTMAVTADGEIDVFRVRVGEAEFLLDLREGILNTGFLADIGFAHGVGQVATMAGFSRPRADLETEMSISGIPLFGGDIAARPRLARVGISIFGMRLAVAFPGLDMLNPSRIADRLKKLLKISFEDLNKALAALLSGNVTMNPFSDFGSGGDGMGNSSDSGKGESGGDDPDDPGMGLGDEAPEGVANGEGEPVEEPSAEGGFAGTAPAELWFARAGEFISIGTGARGSPEEARIALAVPDANHFDESIRQTGQTMAILDRGYSQVLPLGEAYSGAPCGTGGNFAHMVALYTEGPDGPRYGYYELCRIRDATGRPLTPELMRGFNIDARRDLAVFQDALLAELGARENLPVHDHGRILLRARMMADDDLRGVIGFQRVGETLVSMRGSLTGECGTEAQHDPSVNEASRIFWITGLTAEEIDAPNVILPIVRSLWNCEPGTLARLDRNRSTLVTATTVSEAGDEGFKTIAKLPEDTEADMPQSAPPLWVAEVEAAAEARAIAASETTKAEEAAVSLTERIASAESMGRTIQRPFCTVACETLSVIFAVGGANGCVLSIAGNEASDFTPNGLMAFDAGCKPQDPFLWIDVGSNITSAAIVASEAETPMIRVGAFLDNNLALTPTLALGFDLNTITPPDVELISGLVDRFGNNLGRIDAILSDSGEAALRAVLDGRSEWRVRRPNGAMDFTLFGDEPLASNQAKALLSALGSGVDKVSRLDDDHLSVRAGETLRVLRWTRGAWTELATMPDTGLSEAVIEHLMVQDGLPHRLRITIVDYAPEVGGWAYAWADPETGDGSLVVRPVAEPKLDFGDTKPVRLGFSGPVEIDATGPFAWIKLDLPDPAEDFAIEVTGEGALHKVCLVTSDAQVIDEGVEYLFEHDQKAPWDSQAFVSAGDGPQPAYAWVRTKDSESGSQVDVYVEIGGNLERRTDAETYDCADLADQLPQVDFLGLDFAKPVQISRLALADSDTALLATLAAGVLSGELGAPIDLGETPKGQTFASWPADDARVFAIARDGWQPGAPFARIQGAPPTEIWPQLVRRLVEIGPGPIDITGAVLSELPAGVTAWAAPLGADMDQQTIFFADTGRSGEIELSIADATPGILGRIIGYVLANPTEHPKVLSTQPLIVYGRPEDCASLGGACSNRIALLNQDCIASLEKGRTCPSTAFNSGGRGPDDPVLKMALDIFADIAETNHTALSRRAVFDGNLEADGPALFRLTDDAATFVVHPEGEGWSCLVVDGLSLRAAALTEIGLGDLVRLLDFGTPDCTAEGLPRLSLGPLPGRSETHEPGGLLARRLGDGRLLLAGLPRADGIESARQVPDVLADALTADLRDILRAEGAAGLAGLSLIDERTEDTKTILVYGRSPREDPGGGGTISPLIVGFTYPPMKNAESEDYRACVLTGIRVAIPGDVPETDADAIHSAMLKRIDRVIAENLDCVGATSIRLNVLKRESGDYDAFVEGIRANVTRPGREEQIEVARNHHISETSRTVVQGTATSTEYFFGAGDDYSVELEVSAVKGLSDTERSNALRAVIEHLDGLSDAPILVRLDCAHAGQTCTVLTGQWPGGGIVALALESTASGLGVARSAVLIGLDRSEATQRAAVDLLSVGHAPGIWEGAVVTGQFAAVRQNDPTQDVLLSEGNSQFRSVGTFQQLSEAPRSLRRAALELIAGRNSSFKALAVTLPQATGATADPVWHGALLSFERVGDQWQLWNSLRTTGSPGADYLAPVNPDDGLDAVIAAHFRLQPPPPQSAGFWVPAADTIVPLSRRTHDEWGFQAVFRVRDNGFVPVLSTLQECSGASDTLSSLITADIDRLEGPQINCERIDDMTMLYVDDSDDAAKNAVAAQRERSIDLSTKDGSIDILRRFASAALSHGRAIDDLQVFKVGKNWLGLPKPVANAIEVFADLGGDVEHLGIFTGLTRSKEDERLLLAALAQVTRDSEAVSATIKRYGGGSRPAAVLERRIFAKTAKGYRSIDWFSPPLAPAAATLMDVFVETPTTGTDHWAVADQNFGIVFDVKDAKATAVYAVSGGSVQSLGRLAPALDMMEAADLAKALKNLVRGGWRPTALARTGSAFVACRDGPQPELRAWVAETHPRFKELSADGDCVALLQEADKMNVAARTVQPCSGRGHVFSEDGRWFLHRGDCFWHLGSQVDLLCSTVEAAPDDLRRPIARELKQGPVCKRVVSGNNTALVLKENGASVVWDSGRRELMGPAADHALAIVKWLNAHTSCDGDLTLVGSKPPLALDDPCAAGGIALVNGDALTTVVANGKRRHPLNKALLERLLNAQTLFPADAMLFPQIGAVEIQRATEPHEALVIFAQDFAPMRTSRGNVEMGLLLRRELRSERPQAVHAVTLSEGSRGVTLVAAKELPQAPALSAEVDVGGETRGKGWVSFEGNSLAGPSAVSEVSFGLRFSDTLAIAKDPVVFDWLWWQAATEVTFPRIFWEANSSNGPYYLIGDRKHLRFRMTNNTNECLEITRDAAIELLDATSHQGATVSLLDSGNMSRPGTLRWYYPLSDDPRTALLARSKECDPAELHGP